VLHHSLGDCAANAARRAGHDRDAASQVKQIGQRVLSNNPLVSCSIPEAIMDEESKREIRGSKKVERRLRVSSMVGAQGLEPWTR